MLHFVVTYDQKLVTAVEEFPTGEAASAKLDHLRAQGISGTVYSVSSKDSLGIHIGDTRPDDLTDEMDFKGFD